MWIAGSASTALLLFLCVCLGGESKRERGKKEKEIEMKKRTGVEGGGVKREKKKERVLSCVFFLWSPLRALFLSDVLCALVLVLLPFFLVSFSFHKKKCYFFPTVF